eukprot:4705028-Prymnesium_polylepis.1
MSAAAHCALLPHILQEGFDALVQVHGHGRSGLEQSLDAHAESSCRGARRRNRSSSRVYHHWVASSVMWECLRQSAVEKQIIRLEAGRARLLRLTVILKHAAVVTRIPVAHGQAVSLWPQRMPNRASHGTTIPSIHR